MARGRIEGLDVLRGVAVGLVMLMHAWPTIFSGAGIVGVTTFFALSGYLITGLLLRDVREYGRLRLARFYVHRLFRLYPALVALLVGFCIVSLALGREAVARLAKSVAVGLLYVADLPSGAFDPAKGLGHLWTLAVEEQFYFVWPWVVLVGVRIGRLGLILAVSAATIVLASVALPALLPLSAHEVYELPTSWAISLLMGAGARVYRGRLLQWLDGRFLPWTAAAVLTACSFVPRADQEVVVFLILGPVVAAAAIVTVLRLERLDVVGPALKPLLALGTVSYAAYLWNYPIVVWLPTEDNAPMPVGWGLVSIALTVAVAFASWFTVEAAGRRLRARYDRGRADRRGRNQLAMPT